MSTPPDACGRVSVAQLGARRHYAIPQILYDAGALERLYTDAYAGNKRLISSFLTASGIAYHMTAVERFLNRAASISPSLVTSYDTLGLEYFFRRSLKGAPLNKTDIYLEIAAAFAQRVISTGFGSASGIYAFNGAARDIFVAARERGLRLILDQTIAPRKTFSRLMAQEAERWPGWQDEVVVDSSDDRLAERDAEEWTLADTIICGSPFVEDAIGEADGPVAKCRVVRPTVLGARRPVVSQTGRGTIGRPLSLLFAGEVGLRKGAPYLLEALARLRSSCLHATFVGAVRLNTGIISRYGEHATFVGAVPRSQMYRYYREADAFVMPSLCEGASIAAAEAKAYGLPVLCTVNAGATITDGADGLLFEAGSVEALMEALEKLPSLLSRHRKLEVSLDVLADEACYRREVLSAVLGS